LNRPVEKEIPYLFNEKSLIRLAGAMLIDINEEWLTGRRYLVMGGSLDIGLFYSDFLTLPRHRLISDRRKDSSFVFEKHEKPSRMNSKLS